MMQPLHIRARLGAPLVATDALHLDGLLMAAVARRDGIMPLTTQAQALEAEPLEIPLERSACGRYYLCTAMLGDARASETKWVQRRFPVQEAIAFGETKLRKINTSAGACKSFRIPVETHHVEPEWYAVGDESEVRELLTWITGLSRRRAVGHGAVLEWTVEPCEPWGAGFPVLSADGAALRHLPLDTPGLGEFTPRVGNLRPPYWVRPTEELIAAPVMRCL